MTQQAFTAEELTADDARWEKLRKELFEPGSKSMFEFGEPEPTGPDMTIYSADGAPLWTGKALPDGWFYDDAEGVPEDHVVYEALYSGDFDAEDRRVIGQRRVAREAE